MFKRKKRSFGRTTVVKTLSPEILEELWWLKAAAPTQPRRLGPSNSSRVVDGSGASDISEIVAEFAAVIRRRIAEIDQEVIAQCNSGASNS